jgi:hypothetical protein
MSIEAGDAVITISGESGDLDAELQKVDTEVQQTCENITENFTATGAIVAGFGAAIVAAMGLAISASAKEEAMTTRLVVALRNVGIEYDSVKGSLEGWIDRMQQSTSFADTDMRESLSTLILATGDLTKAQDLMALSMDMAVGMGTDLASATSRVSMALAGNWGMLQRYIPALAQAATEEEKWIMLREMFAGQAEEYGKTLQGQFDLLKNNLSDVKEMIGDVFNPALTALFEKINNFVQWIKTLNPFLVKLITIGVGVGGVLALMGGGLLLLAGLAPILTKAIGWLTVATFPKLVTSLRAVIGAMWQLVASFLAALAAAGPWAWAALATGIALIAFGVWKASEYSKKATEGLDDTAQAADNVIDSLGEGQNALQQYQGEVDSASDSLGDLTSSTLDAAGAQGTLATSLGASTQAMGLQVDMARALALIFGDLAGYVRTFQGGLTEAEWGAFFGRPEMGTATWYDEYGNIIFQGTTAEARARNKFRENQLEYYGTHPSSGEKRYQYIDEYGQVVFTGTKEEWEAWSGSSRYRVEGYPGTEEGSTIPTKHLKEITPGFQHGGILLEPTLLYGLRSKDILGIAGEAGKEGIVPTSQITGQTINIDFHIAQVTIREEADIKKLGHAFYQEIAAGIRGRGIKG